MNEHVHARLHSASVYDFDDVVHRRSVARLASGEHRVAEEFHLTSIDEPATLVPESAIALRVVDEAGIHILLEGDGWTGRLCRYGGGHAEVAVSAVDVEVLSKVVASIRSNAPVVEVDAGALTVAFTYHGGDHYRSRRRSIAAPAWDEVRANYPLSVIEEMDQLMALEDGPDRGRLLLWHGPPGTGKTTATRALLRAWRPWCGATFVTDPDVLFREPTYLMPLVLEDEGRWRLLVVEDADELIRADARAASAQALARLLNVADGMIGQGLRVLVLLSTNEPVAGLHPAVARPGRCLSQIHFRRLNRDESTRWLGSAPPVGDEFSLAELFSLRRGETPHRETTSIGQYL